MKFTKVSYKVAKEIYNQNPYNTIYMLPKKVSIHNYEVSRKWSPPLFTFNKVGQENKIICGCECFGFDDFDKVVNRYKVCDIVLCSGGDVSYYVCTTLYEELKNKNII